MKVKMQPPGMSSGIVPLPAGRLQNAANFNDFAAMALR